MFKTRFKAWNLRKNLRPDEALAMVRVKARRDATNTASEFWKHGSIITSEKLERYLRDNPLALKKAQSFITEEPATNGAVESLLPPHIIVLSPQKPMRTENNLYSVELALSALQSLHKSNVRMSFNLRRMNSMESFRRAISSFRSPNYSKRAYGWRYLHSSFKALDSDITMNCYRVTLCLVKFLPLLLFSEFSEVGRIMADYVMELYLRQFGQNFPFRDFLDQFVSLWCNGRLSAECYCLLFGTLEDIAVDEMGFYFPLDLLPGRGTFLPFDGRCGRCQPQSRPCPAAGRALFEMMFWKEKQK